MILNSLINFCSSLEPLSEKLIDLIKQNAITLKVDKNTQLFPDGLATDAALFIASGTLRKYTTDEDKQITLSLYVQNETIGFTETSHYLEDERLETIHDSEIIFFSKSFIEQLYTDCPEINNIARKILSNKYQKIVEESRLSRIPSADRRYCIFNDTIGKIRLPARIIASYLVMREETLSRLKTRHRKIKQL